MWQINVAGMEMKGFFHKCQVPACMILVQLFITGMQLLSKIILTQGTFVFALMTYRHIVATVFVAPFAFFFERDMGKKLSWLAFVWLFVNAMFGTTMAMSLYYYGLRNTSATYASNFLNLVPIVTFFFSVLTGVEKLRIRSSGGRIKMLGAILCVVGALTISLYRGKALHLGSSHTHAHHFSAVTRTKSEWMHGSFMLVGSCLSYACWFLIQVKLLKIYPSKYWATMLTCVSTTFQSLVLGLAIDRSKAAWSIEWNLQLLTIVYSGAFATGASFCLISWAVLKRGPTYPSMFNPLSLIFVAILESLFMGEEITVGSLLGMAVIIGGLYAFLWGRSRDKVSPLQNVNAGDIAVVEESTHIQSIPTHDSSGKCSTK